MENIHSTHKDVPFGWFEALRQLFSGGSTRRRPRWADSAQKAAAAKRALDGCDRPIPRHLAHFG
jgi:hypothetical protein